MKRALILCLLLFGMITQAAPGNDRVLELKLKAAYYEIKAQLEAKEITLQQAQQLWQKRVKHLKREEAK